MNQFVKFKRAQEAMKEIKNKNTKNKAKTLNELMENLGIEVPRYKAVDRYVKIRVESEDGCGKLMNIQEEAKTY